jgi:hypothetical protein
LQKSRPDEEARWAAWGLTLILLPPPFHVSHAQSVGLRDGILNSMSRLMATRKTVVFFTKKVRTKNPEDYENLGFHDRDFNEEEVPIDDVAGDSEYSGDEYVPRKKKEEPKATETGENTSKPGGNKVKEYEGVETAKKLDECEVLAIFGNKAARRRAELDIMKTAELAEPGFYTSGEFELNIYMSILRAACMQSVFHVSRMQTTLERTTRLKITSKGTMSMEPTCIT